MPTDLMVYMGPMLALAGVVLQFVLRQFKAIPEWTYWLAVVILCVGVYTLVVPNPLEGGMRFAIIKFLLWMVGASATVRGGSSGTDALAKSAVANNPGLAGNPLVPKTDSL